MPSRLFRLILLVSSFTTPILAAPHDHSDHDHAHVERGAVIPRKWWQDPDSPAAQLFKRDDAHPGVIGSNDWQLTWPTIWVTPPSNQTPSAWTDRLNQVTADPTFPDYGATQLNGGYPLYTTNQGASLDPHDDSVCSFTYGCRPAMDIDFAPDGWIGLSFDDGPTDASPTLYTYLEENDLSQKATHFMIGSNIVSYATYLQRAFQDGGLICVHTWSHPYMTTKSNEDLVAEFGWTMQIIYDLTGGYVPAFWRPPYGDVDNRVRMIAKEVFGLETVTWNTDTADWAIDDEPGYTIASVEEAFTGYLNGSKSPGLILLEHELNNYTVQVFMDMYPTMEKYGWQLATVADVFNLTWYQNAANNNTGFNNISSFIQTTSPGNISTYSVPILTAGGASSTASSAASTTAASAGSTSSAASGSGAGSGSGSSGGQSATAVAAAASQSKASSASSLRVTAGGLMLSLAWVGFMVL